MSGNTNVTTLGDLSQAANAALTTVGRCQVFAATMQTTAARSFFLGFTANFLVSFGDPLAGVVGGVVSAVASAVDALARPIIQDLFPGDYFQSLNQFLFGADTTRKITLASVVRNVVVLSFTSVAAGAVCSLLGLSVSVGIVKAMIFRAAYGAIGGASMGPTQMLPVRMG